MTLPDSPTPPPPAAAERGPLWPLRLWFTALQFFTRLPVPAWVGWSPAQAAASLVCLPAVGWLVGGVTGGVLLLGLNWWSAGVAVGLSLLAGVLLTGALHEDGLADCCDAFGGGQDREQVLAILKDSRVGSYGVLGLLLVLGLKAALWLDLVDLAGGLDSWPTLLGLALASHALSRWAMLLVMSRLDYARPVSSSGSSSKSAAMAQRPSTPQLVLATLCAWAPLVWLGAEGWPLEALVTAAVLPISVASVLVYQLRRRLGGYVGDALGATQQLAELACLLALAAMPNASGAAAAVGAG